MRRASLICMVVLSVLSGLAKADPLTFTETFVADFQFSLLANTPINGGPTTPFIPFEAVGNLTFTLDPSLNDPSKPTTVPITGFSGVLTGVAPSAFLPYTISPNVQFVGGSLTDIVRDASGNLTSANVTGLSAFWELVAPGLRLFSDTPLVFDGPITSLPFAFGDTIAGPTDFNVFLDTGNGTGPQVAIGRDRTLRAVPEPTSLTLVALGLAGQIAIRRRRSSRGD